MPIRVKVTKEPDDEVLAWFSKHIGPRTHWLPTCRGGIGWEFDWAPVDPKAPGSQRSWYLTVDDDHSKTVTYWMLMK